MAAAAADQTVHPLGPGAGGHLRESRGPAVVARCSRTSGSSSGSSSCSDDDSDARRRRSERSPSSDISELSEPPNAAASGTGSDSNGDQEWPSAQLDELDELADLPTLACADDVLPSSQLDRVWSENVAAAPLPPDVPPPQPPPQAPKTNSTQDEKDDKRRRNREAAVRFRKNKKARESKLHAELASLRERDESWRKREDEWKQREAALQKEKAALQTQLEQLKQLFSKKNLVSGISATICVCMAVVCVVLPVRHTNGYGHAGGGPSAAGSPTGRSLLSIDMATYRQSPGVSLLPDSAVDLSQLETDAMATTAPLDDGETGSVGAMLVQSLGLVAAWFDPVLG